MEIIYFADKSYPFFAALSILLFAALLFSYFFFFIRRKDLGKKYLTNFKPQSFRRTVIHLAGITLLFIFIVYQVLQISSIYLVEKYSDGTLKLKNFFHITLGTIHPDEPIKIEYKEYHSSIKGRGGVISYYAIITTDKKKFKTFRTERREMLSEKIGEIQK